MSDTTVEAKPKFDATAAVKKYAILLILIGFMVILTLVTAFTIGGRLSPAFPRGSMSQAELGLWMAGHGFEGAHAA